jgi:hypothetical protein
MRSALVLLLATVAACPGARAPRLSPTALVTTGETSGYVKTGRYDEAVKLCDDFTRAFDGVFCDRIGTTGEDRPIVALRVEKKPNLPMIYIQAGIHAGEIEGKDAGFAFVRDLLLGKVVPGALDVVSLVFVPVLNPDGHERFGPNHRPNQRGPEEMGFRTNGARQNVNRDFMKADTAEAHAVLGVMRTRDPILLIDLHTTNGAKFEHDISLIVSPFAPRGDQLEETAAAMRDALLARMTALGHLPVDFYPSFIDDDNPLSGFEAGEAPPRFSQFYAAARGRLGLLVETHAWRTYKERALSTYHTLQAIFEDARTKARTWRDVCDAASKADAQLAGKLPLTWKTTKQAKQIEFRGYQFEKRTSDLTGGSWLIYDETKPEIWKVPLFEQVEPETTVDVPRGFVIDGGFAKQVAAVLDRHGITYAPLASRPLSLEVYRVTKVTFAAPYEGRTRPTFTGAWTTETRTPDRGAIYVPVGQPLARLVLHLLDPALPDALVNWGFFNVAFEQKEYMESYMVEQEARKMLDQDPSLRAAFDAAVAADPELAKPQAKLAWFYKRHPAWDERVNLLPVFRTNEDLRAK